MNKQNIPAKIDLYSYPAQAEAYFTALTKAGANVACIYGGVVRDADYNAYYGDLFEDFNEIPMKDYDIRVWLPETIFESKVNEVLDNLEKQGAMISQAEQFNDHPRYIVDLFGDEIDLTLRPKPDSLVKRKSAIKNVACDRVVDAPVGLSAIALDMTMQAWALPQYEDDRNGLKITILSHSKIENSLDYAERLKKKYAFHDVIKPAGYKPKPV